MLRFHRRLHTILPSHPSLSSLLPSLSSSLQSSQLNILPPSYVQPVPGPDDEIVVAMSAGVDSLVTAALYARTHRRVRGVYMANWSQTARCTEQDWTDVQRICDTIGIPCERVNFEKEYWHDVFAPMIAQYEKGLTPNPDTGCNRYVKFGAMIDHLSAKLGDGKWWLATGHYARVMTAPGPAQVSTESTAGSHDLVDLYAHQSLDPLDLSRDPSVGALVGRSARSVLLRGLSPDKDQSFYLASISPQVLSRVLMPIGHMTKPQTRELAKAFGLHVAEKPDSQGLCFVEQDGLFRDFLAEYIRPNPGNIITEDEKVWGQHQGLWHATIGQRLGLSMPQGDPKYKGVWFVSEKRPETNELVIVRGGNNDRLFHSKLTVLDWRWLVPRPQLPPTGWTMQYRSLQEPDPVEKVSVRGLEIDIVLENPARAMAPGQNVVLYKDSQVLGLGVLKCTE